jgi:uncharacterized membrane protein (TIGR02234 family)
VPGPEDTAIPAVSHPLIVTTTAPQPAGCHNHGGLPATCETGLAGYGVLMAIGGRPRTELAGLLLTGAAGAGLVLLALHQGWARVVTAVPRPFPVGSVTVTGQQLLPGAAAMAIAALACLAAVLATRSWARRLAGLALAGLGAGIAVVSLTGVSAAAVRAAEFGSAGPASGTGSAAGSVTAGSGGTVSTAVGTGLPGHVLIGGLPWRGALLAGAAAIIMAGLLVTWRARRLPVLSGRFDRAGASPARPGLGDRKPRSAAALWDSLSRGEDPTTGNTPPHQPLAPRRGRPDSGLSSEDSWRERSAGQPPGGAWR